MNDENLIAEVARIWVDGGGDADGIDWCSRRIKDAVEAEIAARRADAAIKAMEGNE